MWSQSWSRSGTCGLLMAACRLVLLIVSGALLFAAAGGRSRSGGALPADPPAPLDTATWEALGPFGGYVHTVAGDRQREVFAGASDGRFFRRSRADGRWRCMSWGLPERATVNSITTSWARVGTAIVTATGYFPQNFWGIYKTTDSGLHWMELAAPSPQGYLASVALDASRPDYVYMGWSFGLFRSADGGATWTAVGIGLPHHDDVSSLTPVPQSPGVLLAIVRGRVYRTVDYGDNWTRLHVDPSFSPRSFAVDSLADATIYICGHQGVLKSTDGAETWSMSNNGLPSEPHLSQLVSDPLTAGTIYAVGDGTLYRKPRRRSELEEALCPVSVVLGSIGRRHLFPWNALRGGWG